MPSLFNRRLVQGALTFSGSSEKLLNIWTSAVISHSIVKHKGPSVLRSCRNWSSVRDSETIFEGVWSVPHDSALTCVNALRVQLHCVCTFWICVHVHVCVSTHVNVNTFDSDLNFEPHIRNWTKNHGSIARMRPFLSQANTETPSLAFITSRIDYSNASAM